MSQRHSTTMVLFNSSDRIQKIWMEPWGEELFIPAGVGWRVTCESVSIPLEPIEVAIDDNSFAIFGTLHGTTKVMCNGDVIFECSFKEE